MQTVSVPWSMWYENTHFEMTFPDTFQVTVSHMKGGPDIGDAGIRKALAEPIGAPRLRDMARGRRDAAIVIDDLTRPTPTYRTLPYILEELAAGGLGDDKVRIVCGVAAHRAVTRPDLIKKNWYRSGGADRGVVVHNAQDNLEYYWSLSQGIPIGSPRFRPFDLNNSPPA
jgi:nickel-dependent lactate racemase